MLRKQTMNEPMYDVVIIGGGMTGLAAAWRLEQARRAGLPVRYLLVEAAPRLGGKITTRTQDGFLIEHGPDSFLTTKPHLLTLVRALGLEDELIAPRTTRYYLVRHGRLVPAPEGIFLGVPTRFMPFLRSPVLSWPGKMRMGLDLFIPPRRDEADESVGDFVRRRLGREALERLAGPLMAGIHSADPDRLSLEATFPQLRAMERTHGSLIRAMWRARRQRGSGRSAGRGHRSPFLTLRSGLGRLVDALQDVLDPQALNIGVAVSAVASHQAGYTLALSTGATITAKQVLFTTPPPATARLLQSIAPDASQHLHRIRMASSASVVLGFRREDVPHTLLDASGALVPRIEQQTVTGYTFASSKFEGRAPDGYVLLRAFVGGDGREAALSLDDTALVQQVLDDTRRLLGIQAQPVLTDVQRWEKARPQYDVGHLDRVATIERTLPAGIAVVGSGMRGAGLPDCTRQGIEAAEKALAALGFGRPAETPTA
ncbi:hypothetical protein SE16_02820 [Ardenticatena maritima]|nr:hypothetical protein SE16_02820 [Ardenticatena maritima]